MFDTKTETLALLSETGAPENGLAIELPSKAAFGTRNILGVSVAAFSKTDALSFITQAIEHKQHTKIAFLNAHGANVAWVDDGYLQDMSDFTVLADGIGVDVGSIINYGHKFPDNLNGTDFIPALFAHLKPGMSIALLGAAAGIAEIAAENLRSKYPQHNFDVISDGYFSTSDETDVLARLSRLKPDILLVALGNPAQEKWITKYCSIDNCTIAFGVGAYLDFAAGRVPRAPYWLRKLRIEWVFRLWLEPARMWRRYMIGNPLFVMRSFIQKFGLRRK